MRDFPFIVKAECSGESCQEKIVYTMTGNDHFYIDQKYGEIFLISNHGDGSVKDVCGGRCTLSVSAHLGNVQPAQLTVEVRQNFD